MRGVGEERGYVSKHDVMWKNPIIYEILNGIDPEKKTTDNVVRGGGARAAKDYNVSTWGRRGVKKRRRKNTQFRSGL